MSLSALVDLYRACGKPELVNGDFICSTNYLGIKELLYTIKNASNDEFGRFDNLIIDGNDMLDEELPLSGKTIDFKLRLPSSSSRTFHLNLSSLLEVEPTISKGYIPEEFYLIEEDYYSKDIKTPKNIDNLIEVCQLINSLSKLAHYHDEKSVNQYYRLIFIHPLDGNGVSTIVLETKVTMDVLKNTSGLDPRLVEGLSLCNASTDPHYHAKVGVFCTSLSSFISSRPLEIDSFLYLVSNWKIFVENYQRDLSVYLSGFAFHKAKKEVAEAEIKLTGELSKILTDITVKLLSIPISLAAVVAILNAKSLIERFILFIAEFLASVVIYRLVINQKLQFERIKHSKLLVMGAIEGRKDTYPKELVDSIDNMTINLGKIEGSLSFSLSLFSFLSWLPFLTSIVLLSFVYFSEIKDIFFLMKDYLKHIGNALLLFISTN